MTTRKRRLRILSILCRFVDGEEEEEEEDTIGGVKISALPPGQLCGICDIDNYEAIIARQVN